MTTATCLGIGALIPFTLGVLVVLPSLFWPMQLWQPLLRTLFFIFAGGIAIMAVVVFMFERLDTPHAVVALCCIALVLIALAYDAWLSHIWRQRRDTYLP